MKSLPMAVAIVIALCAAFVPAHASPMPPSPSASTVGARVVVCPAADSLLLVIVRQSSGYPWRSGNIVVSFCNCAGFHLSASASDCTVGLDSCRVSAPPDPYGAAQFPIGGGGLCPGGTVEVTADGVVLAVRGEPACFDQNGDLRVDEEDMGIVTAKLGSADPSADFDGDGTVTKADRMILNHHLGHASAEAPARKPPVR